MSTSAAGRKRLFTFASGGWVLALAAVLTIGLAVWATLPAFLRTTDSLGDGQRIESYGFDLANLEVPRDLVVAAMPRRDMVRPLDAPTVIVGQEAGPLAPARGKYLVPADRVIGVVINGEARAYPITVLNVHEIIHDTLGGVPIAVTYHWPCDSVMVFDRQIDGADVQFGVSGLVYNGNQLLYDRPLRGDGPDHQPSLWSQLLGRAISGPLAGRQLSARPAALVSWRQWLTAHPETTAVARDPSITKKRYNKASPDTYFRRGRMLFSVMPAPPENGPAPLSRVVVAQTGDQRRVYPLPWIAERADRNGRWTDSLGDLELQFELDAAANAVQVAAADSGTTLRTDQALWFAWHAMYPGDPLAE